MSPFDRAPFIVIWEATRACALACVHCRAEAAPHRDPGELTTEEAHRLLDRVAAFGDPPPVFVFTGGDPLRRPDILELVAHARHRGLVASLTPSGTAAVTEKRLAALREAGLARLAVSLDHATSAGHDAFRGVRGSHRHTMRILEQARALGLPVQINTTVCRETVSGLPDLVSQIEALEPILWALFFLIPVGRARESQALSADEIEGTLHWAAALAERVRFGVKTTEAPHYLRVAEARRRANGPPPPGGFRPPVSRDHRPDLVGRAGRAVTDGNGILFVDHVGRICPSGFLPIAVASVREADVVSVYREDSLFRELRDPSRLGGRCGRCEYRSRCGGSRARAYAATGDPLAEDPGCAYTPGAGRPRDTAAPEGSSAPPVSAEKVIQALRTVFDPELGLSVVELGLIYGVAIEGRTVRVTMTLTTPGCPLGDVIRGWVRRALLGIPGVENVDVALTFDPPWTPGGRSGGPIVREGTAS